MRSLERFSSILSGLRSNSGRIAATSVAVLAVAGTVVLMDDLLARWDTAEQAPKVDQRAETDTPKVANLAKPDTVRILASVAKVKDAFSSAGYNLDAVRRGQVAVPRVLHASLPHDLSQIQHPQDRKAVFLRYMLPYILEANNRVRAQRECMLTLREKSEKGQHLTTDESLWLKALSEEYRVKLGDFTALSARVDTTVPASLALAQAAIESGWGTSRFAQEGNAPFGQWTSKNNAGMVPLKREDGMTHKVRSFESLRKSVDSYLRNLNTHRAYRALRKVRSAARTIDTPTDSLKLAETLLSYSEKGSGYVTLLRRIIEGNDLRSLDDARLSNAVVVFHPDA